MKTTKFLSAGVMVLLLVGWGMTPGASAHIIQGSLGPSAAARMSSSSNALMGPSKYRPTWVITGR